MAQRKSGTRSVGGENGRTRNSQTGNRGGAKKTPRSTASTASSSSTQRRRQPRAHVDEVNTKASEQTQARGEISLTDEIAVIVALLFSVLFVLSYCGLCGTFGNMVNTVVFGLFGVLGYLFPFILFVVVLICVARKNTEGNIAKVIYCVSLFICIAALIETIFGNNVTTGPVDHFTHSLPDYTGKAPAYGGIIGGTISYLLCSFTGRAAAIIILIVVNIIFFLLIAGRAIFMPLTKKQIDHHREHRNAARLEHDYENGYGHDYENEYGHDYENGYENGYDSFDGVRSRREERARRANMKIEDAEEILREAGEKNTPKKGFIDRILEEGMESNPHEAVPAAQDFPDPDSNPGLSAVSVSAVTVNTHEPDSVKILGRRGVNRHVMLNDDLDTEINLSGNTREEEYTKADFEEVGETPVDLQSGQQETNAFDKQKEDGVLDLESYRVNMEGIFDDAAQGGDVSPFGVAATDSAASPLSDAASDSERVVVKNDNTCVAAATGAGTANGTTNTEETVNVNNEPPVIPYVFPPISLLTKNKYASGRSDKGELKETVNKLQSTFASFGVGVTVTDATCGPTVTRYELLPDQGVKVKTITALADDIKLALAASEIRIEAPIPGKAAVGIEVPNSVTSPVLLRDLIDSPEFKDASSALTFAVGKDIGGKTICFDIAGMPHMLIAGATGSGKSVCINSLIMSILYKAKPSEVKMIMIDPKRVELIGYNGIPHLLVPVVTDVKKASGALNWAIAEMDDRYQRFADAGVNNLASYNRHIEEEYYEAGNEGECPNRLPQILIIVDELNDLMMTANSKEVEASICRLTQLARASGIHVVLATQRPSVNVITGTIKANIPSRIAFSVSSVVDSRTIIDQGGAEKLLGKGDMLFYPQGYPKPVRLQGAYVSDKEVADVVSFVKSRYKEIKYNEALHRSIEAPVLNVEIGGSEAPEAEDERDEYYASAGRFIIEKQKPSIGALQRMFRIGFNRAARIMDSLANDNVVSQEEGTKPRRILMTLDEFNEFLTSGKTPSQTEQETNEEDSPEL